MSKKVERKCGTCRFLQPPSNGKRFHHANVYQCRWVLKVDIPNSFRGWSFDAAITAFKSGFAGYMSPGDGKDCPCWEEREAA